MIIENRFHTDDKNHEKVPMSSLGFPYVCIFSDMKKYAEGTISWHWHTSFEIFVMYEGTMEFRTSDMTVELNKGDAVFVNTGVLHYYKAVNDGACCGMAHLFHMDFLSGAYNSIFEEKYFLPVSRCEALRAWVIHPDSYERMKMISDVIEAEDLMRSEPEGFELSIRAKLCEFWMGLYRETKEVRANAPVRNMQDSERIKKMMDFVQENYSEPITAKDIADAAGISVREGSRCFKRCIGMSPVEHLTEYRILMAARMLAESGKAIIEVSENCGFSSPSYFGKVFRERIGQTPKEYRALAQKL